MLIHQARVLTLVFALVTTLVSAPAVEAAKCPSPKRDGKTVGTILAEGVTVDVKRVDYKEGKDLLPPDSPLNVGVSILHQPLNATEGASLLVWHVNYKGCQGKLNVINDEKPGYKFDVIDEKGEIVEYEIRERHQVRKGKYKPEWFMLTGPRKLVLVTCIGKVVRGSYLDNLVFIATPVVTA